MMKLGVIVSILALLVMAAASLYGWNTIPADAMLARHWDLNGEANGFWPRDQLLIVMPLIAAGLSLAFFLIPKIDPRPAHVRQSQALLMVGWFGVLGLLTFVHVSTVLAAAQGQTAMPHMGLHLYGLSLLIILIGNYTAKSRSNFFLGVRTPWSLSSEHAWSVSNRTGGWLFVLTGLAAAATGLALDVKQGYRVLVVGVLAAAAVSVVVSYLAWRHDPDRDQR